MFTGEHRKLGLKCSHVPDLPAQCFWILLCLNLSPCMQLNTNTEHFSTLQRLNHAWLLMGKPVQFSRLQLLGMCKAQLFMGVVKIN